MYLKLLLFYCISHSILYADIIGYNGKIKFKTDIKNDEIMILTDNGLGVNTSPEENLHINGNVKINEKLIIGDKIGNSNLEINGSIGYGYDVYSTNTTISSNSLVFVNSGSGNIKLNLPSVEINKGRKYFIKKISAHNTVWISGGNAIIDDARSIELPPNSFSSVSLVSDGNQWYKLQNYDALETVSYNDLIIWWKMDELAGSDVFDSSKNEINGNLYSSSFSVNAITGVYGNSLNFDGVDDYIEIEDQDILTPSKISISAWVNLDSIENNDNLISKRNSSNEGGYLWKITGSDLRLYFYSSGRWNYVDVAIPTGTWVHIVATFNGETIKGYVDGELISSKSIAVGNLNNDDSVLRIGSNSSLLDSFTKFKIDDFRIYNIALDGQQIKILFDSEI